MALAFTGLLISAVGVGLSYQASKDASKASKRAEAERKKQANLEHLRARRQRIREARIAHAEATSNLSQQGGLGSSAASGSFSQITAQLGQNLSAGAQNQQISSNIFDANAQFAGAQGQQALGGGFQSFGGSLLDISQSPFFNKPATVTG